MCIRDRGNHGRARLLCQIQHLDNLLRLHLPHRAAMHREILRALLHLSLIHIWI